MRTLRWIMSALAVVALVGATGACEDGTSGSTTEDTEGGTATGGDGPESTEGDGGDEGSEPTAGEGATASAASNETCHNIRTPDGDGESNSTQLVTLDTDLPEGTEIELTYTFDREPAERVGRGVVGADGSAIVAVPLYSAGENGTLASATAGGEPLTVDGTADFTVAPLDDPDTVCQPPASAN